VLLNSVDYNNLKRLQFSYLSPQWNHCGLFETFNTNFDRSVHFVLSLNLIS
jgi:hypothetical protein